MSKKSGVYFIRNKITKKTYVGSSKDIPTRLSNHRHFLNGKGKERSTHKNLHLQRDWNKFGAKFFEFLIVEECPPDLLLEREQHWLDQIPRKKRYNVTEVLRTTLPDEMRRNISRGRRGLKFSEEHKSNLSKAHKGKSYTEKQYKAHVGKHKNKLTAEQAKEIRELRANGMSVKELCSIYGISDRSMYDVINGVYHKEVI